MLNQTTAPPDPKEKISLDHVSQDAKIDQVDFIVSDELLRERIRKLSSEGRPVSMLKKLMTSSHNPLLSVVVATLLGAWLTSCFTERLQEISTRRSFSDELNKVRIQKIGEIWEQIDSNEILLDQQLKSMANQTANSNSQKAAFDNINKIVDEDIAIINKGRFWLGEAAYNQLKDYLDITGRYVSDMLLGPPGLDLTESLKKREKTKQDILRLRSIFLRGERESQPEFSTQLKP